MALEVISRPKQQVSRVVESAAFIDHMAAAFKWLYNNNDYYLRHRAKILAREKKVSRYTVHKCSCGLEIANYHTAVKHIDLTGHTIVDKQQKKMPREQKTKTIANRIEVIQSMGVLGISRDQTTTTTAKNLRART